MEKPSQYEIDTCIEVLEYGIADLNQNEPHAINTINTLEQALSELPRCEEDFGEVN